jgi:hypothetical protein
VTEPAPYDTTHAARVHRAHAHVLRWGAADVDALQLAELLRGLERRPTHLEERFLERLATTTATTGVSA